MDRGDAYKLLAARLNELRANGYDTLLPRVGQPAAADDLQLGGEPITVAVEVTWAGRKHRRLRVSATAFGPSTWKIERLDESFVIGPGGPPAG